MRRRWRWWFVRVKVWKEWRWKWISVVEWRDFGIGMERMGC